MLKKYKPYIISILIALAVGGLSAIVTRNNMNIYDEINMPPLSPPSIVFPIVWTILFILMGIGSGIIYVKSSQDGIESTSALSIYALNLIMNFLWSVIFFNGRFFLFAFIWIILLWIVILRMITSFKKISKAAAYLQIPYLLWVTFAAYLNFMIVLLN